MNYALETVKLIFYLALVLGLIYLVARLFRQKITGQTDNKYIDIIERIYLAPKSSLMLVKVADQVLLIGLSETNIEVLATWSVSEFGEIEIPSGSNLTTGFKEQLENLLKKGKAGLKRDQHD